MLVSFPLIAGHRAIAQAIAASGVSDIDEEATEPHESRTIVAERTRITVWRSTGAGSNPYLTPTPACPECGTRVVRASGCISCPACGWGKCG